MGVSVLRVAACAGLLVGVLLLGDSAAGTAVADPGGAGHRHSDEQSSKAVNNEHPTLSQSFVGFSANIGSGRPARREAPHRPRSVLHLTAVS